MHKDCLRVSSVIKEHKRVCCLIYLFLMEHCLFSFVVECVEKIPEYLRYGKDSLQTTCTLSENGTEISHTVR